MPGMCSTLMFLLATLILNASYGVSITGDSGMLGKLDSFIMCIIVCALHNSRCLR